MKENENENFIEKKVVVRRRKVYGQSQGQHGGKGLCAWVKMIRERSPGESGFPVTIRKLKYEISVKVSIAGENLGIETIVKAGNSILLDKEFNNLDENSAISYVAEFNRVFRHLIDETLPVEEDEFEEFEKTIKVRKRQKSDTRQFNWEPKAIPEKKRKSKSKSKSGPKAEATAEAPTDAVEAEAPTETPTEVPVIMPYIGTLPEKKAINIADYMPWLIVAAAVVCWALLLSVF